MNLELPDHPFQAYIFDCDGTIADTMPLHYRAWQRAMTELGGQFPEDLFYSWGGTPTRKIISQLNQHFGTSLDPDEAASLKEKYYTALIPEALAIEPVVDLVKQFHGTAPMAVCSGGFRELVVGTLDSLGLTDYFDAIICAEDTEHGKPSPDPFLAAARALGVPPAQCLVFEDAPMGVQAAEAAGMRCVLVPSAPAANRRPST
jgi:beta-phosphoglucomutase family hydrolase